MNNKTYSILTVLVLCFGLANFVMAEETIEELELPEAKQIGFFEDTFDRLDLAFTFNQENRMQKSLVMAEKRLAEIELLSETDPEAAQEAQKKYNVYLKKAENAINKLQNKTNQNATKEQIQNMVNAQKMIEEHKSKANGIYTRALVNMEKNNASEEKIAQLSKIYSKINSKNNNLSETIISQKEIAKSVYKSNSEKSEEDIEKEFKNIEKELVKAQVNIQKIEKVQQKAQQMIQENNQMKNTQMIQEQISQKTNLPDGDLEAMHAMAQEARDIANNIEKEDIDDLRHNLKV